VIGGGLGHRLTHHIVARGGLALTVSRVRPTRFDVQHLALDLTESDAWARAVDLGCDRLGGIDVLVNCLAGGLRRRGLAGLPDGEWIQAYRESVLWPLRACLRCLPAMPAGGVIVNVTTVRPDPDDTTLAPAAAAFAASEAMTRTLSNDARERGVRAFGVAPLFPRHRAPHPAAGRLPLAGLDDSPTAIDRVLDLIDHDVEPGVTHWLESDQLVFR
jgi:NAD(P)-dependent dehydrogenase (short-subunit alcohol dehydrogenase family)